jgi:hypothetical protein
VNPYASPGDFQSIEGVLLRIRFEPGASVGQRLSARTAAEAAPVAHRFRSALVAGLMVLVGLVSLGIFLFWYYLSALLSHRPVEQSLRGMS